MRCGIELMRICCWRERNRAERESNGNSKKKGKHKEAKQTGVPDLEI